MKKTLLLLLAAATLVVPCTLTSCGGGGGGGGSAANNTFCVTAKEFANGNKTFYIDAMNLWTLRSTAQANDMILSNPDNFKGTVACWGEITTGSFDKYDAGIAIVYYHYTYNAATNEGELTWSWDAADPKNAPTPALACITTVHTSIEGTGTDPNKDLMIGGSGSNQDPVSNAEHYKQMRIQFNFNTGTCVLYCGCGAMSQELHFDIRKGS